MRDHIAGALRTQAVYVIAKLSVADHLSLGPRSADEIAERVDAHAPTLRRVLRFLVHSGVFIELEDGRFALNRAAEYLQTVHPKSLRRSAIRAGESLWNVSSRLLESVQTGKTAHDLLHGSTFFERKSGEERELEFASRMSSSSAGLGDALASHDVFANARHVVDVGGGHGTLLLPILQRHPHLRGTLFDRAGTIESARAIVARSNAHDRCTLVAGDFFESVPAGDVHLLSWILHDWQDEDALRILQRCREAGGDDATLLIVESVMPARATSSDARATTLADPYMLDLQMLLLTGGMERTLEEYRKLLIGAGYELADATEVGLTRGATLLVARAARS